jgi:hypothetical protein
MMSATSASALVAPLQALLQGSEPKEELLAPLGVASVQEYTQHLRQLQLQVSPAAAAAGKSRPCQWGPAGASWLPTDACPLGQPGHPDAAPAEALCQN